MRQKAMDQVLQDLLGVKCYIDDIIVTGKSKEKNFQNFEKVLVCL